jgi:hypothetical protein
MRRHHELCRHGDPGGYISTAKKWINSPRFDATTSPSNILIEPLAGNILNFYLSLSR